MASTSRAPRAEVARSRSRILDVAEPYFAEHGIDASLHRLAELAGVGVATLFRRFPTRDDLVRALYERVFERFDAVMTEVCAEVPPGWDRLERLLRRGVATVLDAPVLPALLERMAAIHPAHRPGERWAEPLRESVSVAIAAGKLRADAAPLDLAVIPYLFSGLAFIAEPTRSVLASRQLDLLLTGLTADAVTHPLGNRAAALRTTSEEFHRAVHGTVDL